MDNELRQKGIERILNQLGIGNDQIEFVGKINSLEQNDQISAIDPIRGSISRYEIYLKEDLSKKEILNMVRKYGFGNPEYIGKREDPLQINFNGGFVLRFNNPRNKI